MKIVISATDKDVNYQLNGNLVVIDEGVASIWERYRQVKASDNESFGVLVGSRSDNSQKFWIEQCSTPKAGDLSSRAGFTMKDPFHQCFTNKAFEESGGCSAYIGTWHTHPQAIPKPSITDICDWKNCVKRNPDRQLFFVIVGIQEIRVYVLIGRRFVSMNREIKIGF